MNFPSVFPLKLCRLDHRLRSNLGEHGHLQKLLMLFGHDREFEPSIRYSNSFASVSEHGLCAFYQLLQDPWLSPLDALKIILIPGHIEYQSVRFSALTDIEVKPENKENVSTVLNFMNGQDIQLDFIAEETIRSNKIAGSYRVQRTTGQGQNMANPQLQTFGVASTVLACSEFFQVRWLKQKTL